jgi:hypothetical protein
VVVIEDLEVVYLLKNHQDFYHCVQGVLVKPMLLLELRDLHLLEHQ